MRLEGHAAALARFRTPRFPPFDARPSRVVAWKATKTLTYTVHLEPAEEGGYNVFVPALPGCHTQGETYEEAVAVARECIEGFLESLAKDGLPIPREPQPHRPITIGVQVEVPAGVA